MIKSRTHPLIKKFRKLKAKLSFETRTVIIEGIRLIEEGLKSGVSFKALFYTPRAYQTPRGETLLNELRTKAAEFHLASEEVMESLSLEETPPGLLAYVHVPPFSCPVKNACLIFDRIRDPGNAGSLIRTAEGAGASLFFSEESVRPFHPKVVKASMGSIFRVQVKHGPLIPFLKELKSQRKIVVGTKTKGGIPYEDWNWKIPFFLLLGGEAEGLSETLASYIDQYVSISLEGEVESLNVAAAGAVILFEAKRQRKV